MLINEVENIVGLSKKSIRFYEQSGLLSPKRKEENGYRIYNEEDIYKLKIIKFLRELDVPIRELILLSTGELTLKECLRVRILKIKDEEENYNKIKNMCEEIIKNNDDFNNLKIDKYFEEINILNKKERFTMRKELPSKKSRIINAFLSSLVFNAFFIFLIFIISYFQIVSNEKCPWFLFIFLIIILLIPVIAVFYNLVVRIKEIIGGEEDEASKY